MSLERCKVCLLFVPIQRQQTTQQWVLVGSALVLLFLLGIFQYLRNRQRVKAKESALALSYEKAETDKLRELDRLKSNFFANISHEFRTPLTLIQTPLQQALNENSEKETISISTRFARSMHRNAQRLLHLVNQLLDLAKLEDGRMKLKVQEEDIAHIIRTIGYGFESMAHRKQINYQVNVVDKAVNAWFDREKLEHILTNLLSNAFKFTSSEGWIILEADFKKKEEVTIVVRDNGIGIAEDQIEHIFERFYTINDTSSDFTGSGIGMALTKELVALHHGKIEVESRVDHGATFTLTLPISKAAFSEKEILKNKKTETTTKLSSSNTPDFEVLQDESSTTAPVVSLIKDERPIIEVVEDNQDLRTYIREVLHQNYQVIESVNGRKGFEQAKEQIPDLIITDIMMPEMDGNELCRRIRKEVKTSHIPVIMLTAKAEQEEKLEGLETGADDYLTKPFDTRELLARVHNLIEQRRLLRERFAGEIIFKPKEVATTSVDETFLNQVLTAIESNMEEETFSVVELSEQVAMSRSQLHRKLKALVNKSPNQIIREMRLQRAKGLLEKRAGNASEVAFMVGFNSLAYFSKCFKDQFGVAPSEVIGELE
jgi:signal transduction histidine kinase/DNA-binding response OmpR family regulator